MTMISRIRPEHCQQRTDQSLDRFAWNFEDTASVNAKAMMKLFPSAAAARFNPFADDSIFAFLPSGCSALAGFSNSLIRSIFDETTIRPSFLRVTFTNMERIGQISRKAQRVRFAFIQTKENFRTVLHLVLKSDADQAAFWRGLIVLSIGRELFDG
jgi:hypothetical protein